jgi:hypothetical protein
VLTASNLPTLYDCWDGLTRLCLTR